MSEKTFHGIPREEITWHPIIDYNRCKSCGKCIEFCHTKAFGTSETEEKKTIVKDLNACIVLCRGCEDICPAGAISHPSEEKTRTKIKNLRKSKYRINKSNQERCEE